MAVCGECRVLLADLDLATGQCPQCGADLRQALSEDDLIGRELDGRFAIEERIGSGGMGTVYRAKQLAMGRAVAVKVLSPYYASRPRNVRRFVKEARASSCLNHPNIITLYDFGQSTEGYLYIVMELLQGTPLTHLLRQGPLPLRRAVTILDQVCAALVEAHGGGVVHCDLKPDNIFVTARSDVADAVKVLDFGIARLISGDGESSGGALSREVCGTPDYMSPERILGRRVGPETDLYSLGIVLYEVLSGHRPYPAPKPMQVCLRHLNDPTPVLPSTLPADGTPSGPAQELLDGLLAKDPALRIGSAEEVRAELRKLLPGGASGRTPYPAIAPAPVVAPAAPAPAGHGGPADPPPPTVPDAPAALAAAQDAPTVPEPQPDDAALPTQVQCPRCGNFNAGHWAFCGHCGAPLDEQQPCPGCRAPMPPDALFCTRCGYQLAPGRPATPAMVPTLAGVEPEARRAVTAVQALLTLDLPDGQRLDLEDRLELLRPVLARFADEVRGAGGAVHSESGQGLCAVFGVPASGTADALVAVRCALALRDEGARIGASLPGRLEIRCGVSTGAALVRRRGLEGTWSVKGDVVVEAALLAGDAPAGEVLCSAPAWDEVRDAVHAVPAAPSSAGAPRWIVRGVRRSARSEGARGLAGLEIPLIGRETELATLQGRFLSTVHNGAGHLVTLVGPTGVGKSRLVRELLDWVRKTLPETVILEGRALRHGVQPPYQLLRDALANAAGAEEDVGAAIAEWLGAHTVRSVSAPLLALLGLARPALRPTGEGVGGPADMWRAHVPEGDPPADGAATGPADGERDPQAAGAGEAGPPRAPRRPPGESVESPSVARRGAVRRPEAGQHAVEDEGPPGVQARASRRSDAAGAERPGLETQVDAAPEQVHQRGVVAASQLVHAITRGGPLVLVADHLHAADDASLDLLSALVERTTDAPLLVVACACPELYEARPAWGIGRRHNTRLDVRPLTPAATVRLVEALLSRATVLPTEVRELVVQRSEGNPYFAEETVRLLHQRGVLVPLEDGSWRVEPSRLDEAAVPRSIEALLHARVDVLTGDERAVLGAAAIVGSFFWRDAVAQIVPAGLRRSLDAILTGLCRSGLIRRRRKTHLPGETEYRFTSAVLREVVHNGLLRRARQAGHDAVARWLEEREDSGVADLSGALAEHFELGGDPAGAFRWYRVAADRAEAVYAASDAQRCLRRAIALAPGAGAASSRELGVLLERLGDVLLHEGHHAEARKALLDALSARDGGGALRRADILRRIGRTWHLAADLERASETLAGALAAAGPGPSSVKMAILAEIGWVATLDGRHADAEAALQAGVALAADVAAETLEDRRARDRAHAELLSTLGAIASDRGRRQEAICFYEQARALYWAAGQKASAAGMDMSIGAARVAMGRAEGAIQSLRQALDLFEALGHRLGVAAAHNNLGRAYARLGNVQEAEAHLLLGRTAGETLGAAARVAEASTWLAELALAQRQVERALVEARRAVTEADRSRQAGLRAAARRALAAAHVAAGRPGEARRLIQEALGAVEPLGPCEELALTAQAHGVICLEHPGEGEERLDHLRTGAAQLRLALHTWRELGRTQEAEAAEDLIQRLVPHT